MKVIGLDPGGTTGYAVYEDGRRTYQQRDYVPTWAVGQLPAEKHHTDLWKLLTREDPDLVVCERFLYQRRELTEGVSLVLVSVEYIGVAELYCQMTSKPLVMQSPSQAKNLWPDEKLKRLGLYVPASPHSNDATRHVLYYLTVTVGDREWVRKARPPASAELE